MTIAEVFESEKLEEVEKVSVDWIAVYNCESLLMYFAVKIRLRFAILQ